MTVLIHACEAGLLALNKLCQIWFAYFQLQSNRHSALRKLWKVIRKAANSHWRDMWVCCGMMSFTDLPRTLFIPWPTASSQQSCPECWNTGKRPPPQKKLRTLWGEDSSEIPFRGRKRGLYALPWGHTQLLFKVNILNLKNADFSYISRVRQYSTLKDYYYFYKKVKPIQIAPQISRLSDISTAPAVGTRHISFGSNTWFWTVPVLALCKKK